MSARFLSNQFNRGCYRYQTWICVYMCNGSTARVWNVVVKEQRVQGGWGEIYIIILMCTFLVKTESGGYNIPNVDMWEGTRSAWHSKSLERRCQTLVRMFPGCY